jgi:acetyltransferase-like isoleucine patch superfamily enzyme
MSRFEDLLSRLLQGAVDASVKKALAAHLAQQRHGFDPDDLLFQHLVHGDRSRLHIHDTAVVNNALFNLESGDITVAEYAFFGHNVSVLTGTHDVQKFDKERQDTIPKSGRDVVIERGAWLASDVLVLGPCTIGEHAVVGAGSLVTRDVQPFTIVSGRPAKMVREIENRPRS